MTLVPAFGRDYTSKKAMLIDFNGGKDFQIADIFSKDSGRYTSKKDLIGTTVFIRYKGMREVACVKITAKL